MHKNFLKLEDDKALYENLKNKFLILNIGANKMKIILMSFLLIFSQTAFSQSSLDSSAMNSEDSSIYSELLEQQKIQTCLLKYQIALQEYNACINYCTLITLRNFRNISIKCYKENCSKPSEPLCADN